MIDEGFIRRTYRTTAVVWAIIVFAILAFEFWFAALGFTVGTAVSLGVLASLDRVIRRVLVPGRAGAGKALAKFGILKFLAVAVVVSGVVMTRRFDLIIGFCGGIALTQIVMFLKALGITLVERLGG
ncbi:MAG: hypothetical protein HYX78_06450 [Armatimonadetes bacterium]|nr:hypothetical protein [Armatimonadota bacterium]